MNLSTSARHFDLLKNSQQPFGTGAPLQGAPAFILCFAFFALLALLGSAEMAQAKNKEKSPPAQTADKGKGKKPEEKSQKKEPSSPLEAEAQNTLNKFLGLQKAFLKKSGRYASEMFELIPPRKKKEKAPETIQNSHVIVSFSPACVLTSAASRKATRLLLYYPEFPDDKKAILQLNANFAKQFEFLLKKKIKDLPKGKCPANTKGFELYAVGIPDGSKNPLVWSIDQDGNFKKSR